MDWLLGCFTCGQRRQTGCSIARLGSQKDARQISVTAGLGGAVDQTERSSACDGYGNPALKTLDSGKVPFLSRSESARNPSGSIKIRRRHRSTSELSSDHSSIVEKLEEEIDKLNEKLIAEASQASILTNEIRHVRQCSELLDSCDAFKRALEAFQDISIKQGVEETHPLLYMQSMLSKLGTTKITTEALSEKTVDGSISKMLNKESGSPSSFIKVGCNYTSTHDLARVACDHLRMDSNAEPVRLELEEEHGTKTSVCHSSFEVLNMDSCKSQSTSERRRRSSTTYSFSGFIVIENEIEDRTVSDLAVSDLCRSKEASGTNVCETPDSIGDTTVEASKSLFSFASTGLKGHFVSEEKPHSHCHLQEVSVMSRDSGMEVFTDSTISRNLNFANFSLSAEVEAAETPTNSGLTEKFKLMRVNCLGGKSVPVLDSEENLGLEPLFLENRLRSKSLSGDWQASSLDIYGIPDSHRCASNNMKLSGEQKSFGNISPSNGSLTSCILQTEPSKRVHDSSPEISTEEAFSASCLSSDSSIFLNAPSALLQVFRDGNMSHSEIPSTPVSVNSRASFVPLSTLDPGRLQITPMRTFLPSFSNAQTPDSIDSQSFLTDVEEDRPILGTVAAHTDHSSSSTKNWWDGKGIPNSTNKYKEDQKVSWHTTPFEMRLERALAKQGRGFQKWVKFHLCYILELH